MTSKTNNQKERSLGLLALMLLVGGAVGYILKSCRRTENVVPSTPMTSAPPPFDPTMIRRAPPSKLDATSIEAFVRWVASTPVTETQNVRDAIASARADDGAVQALITSLFDLPVKDLGYHQLLLSIIGEMRRPEFSEPLIRFINLPEESIVRNSGSDEDAPCGACTSYLDAANLLKARSVEMLAYLGTKEALESVLGFASHHNARIVRLAALDAYIYNHGDSVDAIELARFAAGPQEAKFVGLPRLTRDSDPEKFSASVAAFYEQYPQECPPKPERSRRYKHKGAPGGRSCG